MMITNSNYLNGYETIKRSTLHRDASILTSTADILTNAATKHEETNKVIILLGSELFTELLACIRCVAADITPPGTILHHTNGKEITP